MPRDFYATVAQVSPVLLLALVFESKYLNGLRTQRRRHRRDDPVSGVRFWTKPRVRVYVLVVLLSVLVDTALCVVMLAGGIPDSIPLRVGVMTGLVLAMVSLGFRIWVDVVDATREDEQLS